MIVHRENAHAYEKTPYGVLKKEEKEVSIANLVSKASEQTKECVIGRVLARLRPLHLRVLLSLVFSAIDKQDSF